MDIDHKHSRRRALASYFLLLALLIAASTAVAGAPAATTPALSITVSMDRPTSHYYHVVFRADGLKGETQDFKMPAWTPGYYRIMDYAKNVKDFRAEDGAGQPARPGKRRPRTTWRVRTGKAASVVVSYDVYAFTRFVRRQLSRRRRRLHHPDRCLHARRRPAPATP